MRDWITIALSALAWIALTVFLVGRFTHHFPIIRQVAISARTTAIIVAAILPVLGLMDVLFAKMGGNEATVSAVMLTIRVKFPLVAKCVSYSFGLFVGHVFFPSAEPEAPEMHEIFARLIAALGPTFYAIILIASGDGQAAKEDITAPKSQAIFAVEMLAWHIAGGLIGRFWLSQHPLALAGVLK